MNDCPCEFCEDDLRADAAAELDREPAPDWRNHLDYARDYIQDADRFSADDLSVQRKMRLAMLESAEEQIRKARELLNGGAR